MQATSSLTKAKFHRSSVTISAGCAMAMLFSIGCAGPARTTRAPDDAEHVKPLSLTEDEGAPDGVAVNNEPLAADDIARQFEQDLADLEALQSGRQPVTDDQERPFPEIPHQTPRPQVVFNQPDRPATSDQPRNPTTQPANVEPTHVSDNQAGDPTVDETTNATETLRQQASSDAPPEVRLREAMVALRRELYRSASYDSQPLRQYIAMSALTMVDAERALNPDAFPDLREEEKELLRAYQAFFISLGKELERAGDEAKVVDLLDQLRKDLVRTPQLRIARAELCTRVDGFGSFTAFDRNAFLAGEAQPVVIYTEIESFTSKLNDENLWVTDLWQELIIYNSHDNVPVWHQPWQAAPDKSANKREDFFISYIVTLPERLTVGQYTLKVRVRDDATGIIAEAGIPFRIVADPQLAATLPR